MHRELQSAAAPDPLKRFLAEGPDWLDVRAAPEIDPALRQLDTGEREVIALALSIGSDFGPTRLLLNRLRGGAPRD